MCEGAGDQTTAENGEGGGCGDAGQGRGVVNLCDVTHAGRVPAYIRPIAYRYSTVCSSHLYATAVAADCHALPFDCACRILRSV